jgi:SAM-dependent methyltransferase
MSADELQQRSEQLAETAFIGGPKRDFVRVGSLGFQVLLAEGLLPSSRVLDVGCGALRLGYWLMRFLDPGRYHGIEVQRDMLNMGLEQIVEPEVVRRAEARFDHNDRFDFSVFGERFDFVYARSIWTHASKPQITAMLDSFAATAAPDGVFLASYYPASQLFRLGGRWARLNRVPSHLPVAQLSPLLARLPSLGLAREYEGDEWAGISHRSDEPGVAKHSLRWVARQASQRGLVAQLAPYRVINRQYWLRIVRANG